MAVAERWHAYLVRCADGSLYCGASNDVEARFARHRTGRGARYTRGHGAAELAWRSSPLPKRLALSLEARIKRLDRADKLQIAGGNGRTIVRRLLAAGRQALALASSSAQRA
jgi:putative endonuclease